MTNEEKMNYRNTNYLSPSEDANTDVEVDITNLSPGNTIKTIWLGQVVFIKYRTDNEMKIVRSVDIQMLPDPMLDESRVKQNADHILVIIGKCTHLGCLPIEQQGDFDGWFCPCHGSYYDCSGRILRGPAQRNLEIPPYKFLNSHTILIGQNDS